MGYEEVNERALIHYCLLRATHAGEKGVADSELRRGLKALGDLEPEALRRAVSSCGDRLVAAGLARRAGARLAATEDGGGRARTFVGAETLPPKLGWAQFESRWLVPKLLSLPAPGEKEGRRISSAAGLRAALLNRAYKLGLDAYPTLVEVRTRLAWRKLGDALGKGVPIDASRPFATGAVLDAVLGSLAGDGESRSASATLGLLAARIVGAPAPAPAALRRALLRRWLLVKAPQSAPAPATSSGATVDLEAFAKEVKAAAEGSSKGRFGRAKVFLSAVFEAFNAQREEPMVRADFDQLLLSGHKEQLLTLSRADLVEAMDPEEVAKSQLADGGATYHFLRLS